MRDKYILAEQLSEYAQNIAKGQKITGTIKAKKISDEILSCLREIKNIHHKITQFSAENKKIPQEMEWLLDNWYIAEREGKESARSLMHAGFLRKTEDEKALIAGLSMALVVSGRNEVTGDRIRIFLESYQKECVLSEKEISVLIPVIKGALIWKLRDICVYELGKDNGGNTSLMIGNVFSSLRLLSNLDVSDILEEVSYTEKILSNDPAKIYNKMDEATRQNYRRVIARLAKKKGLQDYQIAERVLDLAKKSEGKRKHVGYYIFEQPMGDAKRNRDGGVYIGAIVSLSLIFSLWIAVALGRVALAILFLFPISEIVKNLIDYFVIKITKPVHVHRMKFEREVPLEGRTLCVISALLTDEKSGASLAKNLEEYSLANRCGPNLIFGILADFPESKERDLPKANDWLNMARAEIEGLNSKYGGGFVLLCRDRRFNSRDGRYMGWERKRGALLELTRLLRGKESGIRCEAGSLLMLEGIKYVITLDSDTRLNVGSAKELIGAMLHPLNKPEISGGIVAEGTGLIQPRVGAQLEASYKTDFTRLFAGQGGIDPYGSASSDVYQDLFGEGTFTGKGIFDVDAYDKCLDDTFPENTILSHDLLEGAYLGASFMGDVELSDGFPRNILSYYKRMHRWTRGDWQSSLWLFSKVKNAKGEKVSNPISKINKWKIFDNLRRSFTPVLTTLSILAGMLIGGAGFFWTGMIAIISSASNLLINSADLMFRRKTGRKIRYQSTIISGFAGGLLETISFLILLPYHAYICLNGILTALYRMFISKKNMLSWVSASDTEKRSGNTLGNYITEMFPAIILGVLVIAFSANPAAIAMGIVWLLSPAYAYSISRERKGGRTINEEDKLYLTRAAGDIWRYFEDFLTPGDHFLPPDNWQEQPAAGIAHRTSPTNIGLAMLSALSAIDLNLCPKTRALGYIENIIATVERMEKWRGHLYNWYDTKTLKPLHPVYVSAVDSGNYAGCLIVLREALYELGENDLAARSDALLNTMDFEVLFDDRRKLFYIGWDIGTNTPTEGWYDQMASEARQTSFIAIARGDVPAKHWRHLGRTLVSQDNYCGMASWTGTMFEYLMPNLIMPCYKNSLIYESLKFCVYAQKKHHKPWGVSESAFYSFDPDLNYSYKAHGVQRLAFKRGLNKEIVISPYSTFLALPLNTRGAISNLRRMEALGATGRYGFYEALDFTPKRQTGGKYQIVKNYMAHHLAMSLLSICNTLNDNIMQKRFLQDRAMAAYSELLQEKVPVGKVILRQPPREVPEKPPRMKGSCWTKGHSGVDVLEPACTILSNGGYSVVTAESGITRSMLSGGIMLTRFEPKQTGESMGMGFYLKSNNKIYCLQAAPEYNSSSDYSSEFTGSEARLFYRQGEIESAIAISVPKDELGEIRRVTLKNNSEASILCELVCYFEPVLDRPDDYFAHPAFSKLGLETSFSEGTIVVKRRSNGEKPERFMAFSCDEPMEYDTSREIALKRDGIIGSLSRSAGMSLGTVLDPCVMVRVQVSLKPNQSKQISFALAIGEKERDAVLSARRILNTVHQSGMSYLDTTAQKLGMKISDIDFACDLLTDLIFLTSYRKEAAKSIISSKTGQSGLWPFGISGDLPIIAVYAADENNIKRTVRCIKSKILLHKCGVIFDLVIIVYDGGDYRQPVRTEINGVISDLGMEAFIGARGGIHIVDGDMDISAILSAARRVISPAEQEGRRRDTQLPNVPKRRLLPDAQGKLTHYFDKDASFIFEAQNGLPANTWWHMLANNKFGYIATDSGTGHMWHLNARENKITPWNNDTLITEGSERLELIRDGERISLFANIDGCKTKVTYGFGFAIWEKVIDSTETKVTAFVPPERSARVFIIQGDFKPDDKIFYYAELIMGADEKNAAYLVTEYDNGVFSAVNAGNPEFPDEKFSLIASEPEAVFTCDKREYLMGKEAGTVGAGLDPCIAATWSAGRGMVIVCGCDEPEDLRELVSYSAAEHALEATKNYWIEKTYKVTINTPDDNLNNFINGWAAYQTLACRLMGRSSVYQCGGAYGFRDQLQDASAFICRDPQVTKRQIIMAARHQYVQGDVQHWWHPSGLADSEDKGVRTRCSDDLLWLPYVLCEYVEATGDMDILNKEINYIESSNLSADEHERYELPGKSKKIENIFFHAVRAVDLVLRRGAGAHGLALVGTGDWNDGMNMVGVGGKGESVWLTWFLCHVLERFAKLCKELGEDDRYHIYSAKAASYAAAANNAWDGDWFLRGYYDKGDTLGSSQDKECRIDAIAQSFSTMTSHSDSVKVQRALASAVEMLHDKDNKIIKLFTPPFENGEKNPGYIRGYAPGLRENGGQYTHGAIWLAMGCLNAGMTEEAWDMLSDMLPSNHDENIYRIEPYVIAADVYANPQHTGRGGWSWYTGAAGWYLRVITENLLGLRMRKGLLYIEPNLPESWNGFSVKWKHNAGEYNIEVRKKNGYEIFVNGSKWDFKGLPLGEKTEIKSS